MKKQLKNKYSIQLYKIFKGEVVLFYDDGYGSLDIWISCWYQC